MALEIKQTLKLTQQLVMTPQLQQAIKLLQLSRIELLDLIRQEMEENPVLEEVQEASAEKTDQEMQIAEEIGASPEEGTVPESSISETEFDWRNYLYHEAKTPWDPLQGSDHEAEDDDSVQLVARSPDQQVGLQSHLLEQLVFSSLDQEEKKVGELIIGNLDANGYLTASLEELCALSGMPSDRVETVLKQVQSFDPQGVAARNLRECLLLQLKAIADKDRALVEKILSAHLHDLGSKKYDSIARALHVRREDVIRAVKAINTLNPKPGRAFDTEKPKYITPDLSVYKIGDEFVVVLNEDGLPRLHINSFYRQILFNNNLVPEGSKEFIQNKLRSAVWLIKSIYHRQNTLRNVMYSIIKFQREFFNKGISFLKPLLAREQS